MVSLLHCYTGTNRRSQTPKTSGTTLRLFTRCEPFFTEAYTETCGCYTCPGCIPPLSQDSRDGLQHPRELERGIADNRRWMQNQWGLISMFFITNDDATQMVTTLQHIQRSSFYLPNICSRAGVRVDSAFIGSQCRQMHGYSQLLQSLLLFPLSLSPNNN